MPPPAAPSADTVTDPIHARLSFKLLFKLHFPKKTVGPGGRFYRDPCEMCGRKVAFGCTQCGVTLCLKSRPHKLKTGEEVSRCCYVLFHSIPPDAKDLDKERYKTGVLRCCKEGEDFRVQFLKHFPRPLHAIDSKVQGTCHRCPNYNAGFKCEECNLIFCWGDCFRDHRDDQH
jgi:hypothetical protein